MASERWSFGVQRAARLLPTSRESRVQAETGQTMHMATGRSLDSCDELRLKSRLCFGFVNQPEPIERLMHPASCQQG